MQSEREAATVSLPFDPACVVVDYCNVFSDYVCDTADGMEAALKQQPELADKHREIEQGVDRWLMKMQRTGDTSFDRFEARALEQNFHIPHDLQQVHGAQPADAASADDAEAAELWAQLQQRVAVKRELKRKLAGLRRLELAWEAQRASFEQMATLYRTEDVEAVLQKAQRLHQTLQSGLGTDGAAAGGWGGALALRGAAPLTDAQRRREAISTVSVRDLQQLSAVLCT